MRLIWTLCDSNSEFFLKKSSSFLKLCEFSVAFKVVGKIADPFEQPSNSVSMFFALLCVLKSLRHLPEFWVYAQFPSKLRLQALLIAKIIKSESTFVGCIVIQILLDIFR